MLAKREKCLERSRVYPEGIFRKFSLPSVLPLGLDISSLDAAKSSFSCLFSYPRSYFTEVYKRRVNIGNKINRVEIAPPKILSTCSIPGQSSGNGKTPLFLQAAPNIINLNARERMHLSTPSYHLARLRAEKLTSQPDAL